MKNNKRNQFSINFNPNFEAIVFLGVVTFCLVILIGPDYESKVLYKETMESLITGFLGYVTRIAHETYTQGRKSIEPYLEEGQYSDIPLSVDETYNEPSEYESLLAQKDSLEAELQAIASELEKFH